MFRLHVDESTTSAPTDVQRRVRSRRVRSEAALEPAPAHGSGEVLDLFLWGTLRRSRAPIELEVREAVRDLAVIAREALPRAHPEIHLDPLPLEPAIFELSPGGPDQIRLGFRVVSRTGSELKTWRARVADRLKALGVDGGARPDLPR